MRALVATARSVAEAKNAARFVPPDAILCDLRLDGDFAIEFLTWLRAQPRPLKDVPAIAMTGFYEDFPRAKAADVAFKAFFRKPVTISSASARRWRRFAAGSRWQGTPTGTTSPPVEL